MAQLQFSFIRKDPGKDQLHLVVYVGEPGMEVEYCLVVTVAKSDGKAEVRDAKQARYDDVQNYLLSIFRNDVTSTSLSCQIPPAELLMDTFRRALAVLAVRVLGLPQGTQVTGLDRLQRYMTDDQGCTAWEGVLDQVNPSAQVTTQVRDGEGKEEASLEDLLGTSSVPRAAPASTPRANPASKPVSAVAPSAGSAEEGDFESLLGGGGSATSVPAPTSAEPAIASLPKQEKVAGAEGKLVYFTARYSKILDEFARHAKEAREDLDALKPVAAGTAKAVRKLIKDVTAVEPGFWASKKLESLSPSFNQIYVRELHLNLPEFKERSRSEIVRLLSMELTASTKKEPESISVQFLFKPRFDQPPGMGDRLRDMLRFSFGKPLALEESWPIVTKKVDLTKLYFRYRTEDKQYLDTGIFTFRELDGKASLVYVPYDYLGTGAVNQLLAEFFARPWQPKTPKVES